MLLDRTISIILILFSSIFFVLSLQIENRTGDLIAPGSWPAGLLLVILVLSVVMLKRTFGKQKGRIEKTSSEKAEDLANDEEKLVYPAKFFYLFGALVVYTFLLDYVGFILDTVLFIFVLALVFGMKKWTHSLLTGILATAGAVVLFPLLLNTPFPRGTGIFSTFSLLFY
ncbi:tripartite tricarboxylate transporter TctB family protein [Bacillus sp. FJAT-27251]|uniref:tripartite tricarboxylate transporter TctB family protein n=1 Tax=Bacillus sp. FJAT-27251 TaxID=1684142 RepID=UPI0006A7EB67|nr:tripartite tricarboxylate transporter TctB family protein [Bacillus sp. FJAT-27251]